MTDIENPNIRIGERLRAARKNLGMLQETAAQHLGVARPTLVAIEKGQRPIRRSELRDLAALYHVSQLDYFRSYTGRYRVSPACKSRDYQGRASD